MGARDVLGRGLDHHPHERLGARGAQQHAATSSPSRYTLSVRMPEVEDSSIAASLAPDGKRLLVQAKRKIEGCTCTESTVQEVLLPYRPRAEDVGVSLDSRNNILTVSLAREASDNEPTPIAVEVKATDKEAAKKTDVEPAPPSLEEKEKTLTEKFRAAGAAASLSSRASATSASVEDADV